MNQPVAMAADVSLWCCRSAPDTPARKETITISRAERHDRKGKTMDQNIILDGTVNNGRKGIAYNWQALYAASAVDAIQTELAAMQPSFAD